MQQGAKAVFTRGGMPRHENAGLVRHLFWDQRLPSPLAAWMWIGESLT